jgi:D-alanine-D-alanine ligase
MRVGLTYDLRDDYLAAGYSEVETAEFDQPETIDAIAGALQRQGLAVDRIGNAQQLTARLVAGDRWDLVFNFCEGLYGFGRESLVPALLDAWQIPYVFSDPLACALTLHKGMAKHVVRGHGLATPDFAVIESPADLAAGLGLRYPLFAKPVAEGTGKGISIASRIDSPGMLEPVCQALLDEHRQPVLIEEFLPGREFTVGLIGTGRAAEALGTMEVHFGPKADPGIYTFDNKAHWEGRVSYALLTEEPLVQAVEALAVSAWRALGCRDGGRLDIRLDAAGIPNFIEANPLAGLNPGHSDLPFICRFKGISFDQLIQRIVASALSRATQPSAGSRGKTGQ